MKNKECIERIYTIAGVIQEGDEVKLILADDIVKEKPSLMSMVSDLSKMQQQMTYHTKKIQDPDHIRIPYDSWDKHQWNIGHHIKITVEEA